MASILWISFKFHHLEQLLLVILKKCPLSHIFLFLFFFVFLLPVPVHFFIQPPCPLQQTGLEDRRVSLGIIRCFSSKPFPLPNRLEKKQLTTPASSRNCTIRSSSTGPGRQRPHPEKYLYISKHEGLRSPKHTDSTTGEFVVIICMTELWSVIPDWG